MAQNLRPNERGENDLIGNILTDGDQNAMNDLYNMRMEMGKSLSAPPPGLFNTLGSQSPDITKERPDMTGTEDYYNYYYSLKPHDPRLPLPKWKPAFTDSQPAFNDFQNKGGFKRNLNNDQYGDVNNFATHFDQAVNLNIDTSQGQGRFGGESGSPIRFENSKRAAQQQFGPIQGQQYNQVTSPGIKSPQLQQQQQQPSSNNYRQNQGQNMQQSHGNKAPHGGHNQGQQRQGQNQGHGGHGQGQQRQYQQQGGQQRNFEQPQQFYPGMEQQGQQQMGGFYQNPNYMYPQMQPPQFYGMNNYQNPMYPPYGMDPNMSNPQNQFGKMPGAPYGGNQMNQMGGNPYYMGNQPYGGGNNFAPTSFPQQQHQQQQYPQQSGNQGGYQQGGFAGNQGGNKGGQRMTNKPPGPKLDIKTVLANLIENCKDQNGSRLIQQHFEKSSDKEKEQMFSEIEPEAYNLMTDVFGNYVIQKILELGSIDQKLRLFEAMQDNIVELSKHTYGCRVVQRTLEELRGNGPVQDDVLKQLSGYVIPLIQDQNGNHVVQKCFETMPADKTNFIIKEVSNNINDLAFHAYGCRVIQRILEHSSPEITAPMLSTLMSSALRCCESQYGNYIMQYILEKGPHAEKEQLLDILKNNFVRLSTNKFASNVTEKSVLHGTPEFRREVTNVLCNTYYENKLSLVALMTHSFANYVVQRLFECSDEQTRRVLYDTMQGSLEEIRKTNYGKHVMTFIEKLMMGK